MAAVGIVCEYNPFHLGHEKQLRMARERLGGSTPVVCLMSGNFVQRGAPALFDKTVRARAAVECGASLVLELPVTCALSSAEGFARGAVEIFDRLGTVDTLCFGSETGDAAALVRAAEAMTAPVFTQALRLALTDGLSYPAARQRALEETLGDGALLTSPNDILAAEYCKALFERRSRIRPLAVRREGGYHDETPDAENPSATAVRAALLRGEGWRQLVPEAAAAVYDGAARYTLTSGERAMLARLRGMPEAEWAQLPFGFEGLWSKLRRAVQTERSVEEILCAAKSKRYPRTRLQRMLMCGYLGITQTDLARPLTYVRVLAFDERGRAFLRRMRQSAAICVINAGERPADAAYYALECRCAALYGLFAESDTETLCAREEALRIFRKQA